MYANLDNGIRVFYREAGDPANSTILLLHGFPSSSNQFRNLIPLLADKYHVLAPDLPGFGFTQVPSTLNFAYSFENLAATTAGFLDALKIQKYAVYVFDYGAPTGFRLALERPEAVTAIFTQNGNAYEEGLLAFWDPIRKLWAAAPGSPEDIQLREAISDAILTFDATRGQYLDGEPAPEHIDPASFHLDYALLERPGNKDIQLDLFRSYGTNVALYPRFQKYLRDSKVPVMAVWGRNDVIFPPAGAEAFKRDVEGIEVVLLDGGHFLVESHTKEIAGYLLRFLAQNGI